MQPYQKRVFEEKEQLDNRIAKLHAFVNGEAFAPVPKADKDLLAKQLRIMTEYSKVLDERIAGFADAEYARRSAMVEEVRRLHTPDSVLAQQDAEAKKILNPE